MVMAMALSSELGARSSEAGSSENVHKRIKIVWGIKTKTQQVWDGSLVSDGAEIVRIKPFIRHGMLDDSKLTGELSWKSTTYNDVEGIYIDVVGSMESFIHIDNDTHPFSFRVGNISPDKPVYRMDGDIEISDVTDNHLVQIAGLEYGRYGHGLATITPAVAYVDSFGSWTLTFTADESGLPVGGGIRIAWHFSRSWPEPQFTNPTAPNYATVSNTGSGRVVIADNYTGLFEYPFTRGSILIEVIDEGLKSGDEIMLVLGDQSGGSPGMKPGVVSEESFEFRVESCTELPNGGFPIYRRIREVPRVTINTELSPENIFAVAPSMVALNESFDLKIAVEDRYRNTAENYSGDIIVRASVDGQEAYSRKYRLTTDDKGSKIIDGLVADKTGTWQFAITGEDGLKGISNPMVVNDDDSGLQLFWGDLHGHTKYSDGYGEADQFFNFARYKAMLDFVAITDHDVELDAPDFTVAEMYREVRAAISKYDDPKDFLALWAWEWSPNRITETSKRPEGDHNVFFFQKKGYMFPTGNDESNSIDKLYKRLNELPKRTKMTVIPHVGGAIANWEYHDPKLQTVAEIYSNHGSFEQFGQIALDKGYKIGFVGAADSHNGQNGGYPPGNPPNHFTHGGLTAVYTKELSQKSLHSALENRQVYATTGKRIIIDYSINGNSMGESISLGSAPEISVEAIGEQPIWKIDIIRNGEVIHTQVNEFNESNRVRLLWHSEIARADLLDFDAGFWGRRLRIAHWQGKVTSPLSGLKLLAPLSFDYPKDNIISADSDSIVWESDTRGDYDGISFEVGDPTASLQLSLIGQDFSTFAGSGGFVRFSKDAADVKQFTVIPSKIPDEGLTHTIGPLDTVKLLRGEPLAAGLAVNYTDATPVVGESYYYVRITQIDGEMAWSSPIWVTYKEAVDRSDN